MQEKSQPHKLRGAVGSFISLLLLGGAAVLFLNRQYVIDQFRVWQFQPSSQVQALSSAAQMTQTGRFYFYSARPEIDDRSAFNDHCHATGEQTAVLGCYAAQRIYVFDITDKRLDGIKEVTAAHEMLHAVYERLSPDKKANLQTLLEAQLKSVTDPQIKDLIAVYDQTEPGERLNELHSLFATEVSDLSPELESYYAQYFTDRRAVVALWQKYEAVFSSIRDQQTTLLADLKSLADSVTSKTSAYNSAAQDLGNDITTFNERAKNGGYSSVAAFDADRQRLIDRQTALTQQRQTITQMIQDYSQKQKNLESLNGQAEALNKSINSTALDPQPAL